MGWTPTGVLSMGEGCIPGFTVSRDFKLVFITSNSRIRICIEILGWNRNRIEAKAHYTDCSHLLDGEAPPEAVTAGTAAAAREIGLVAVVPVPAHRRPGSTKRRNFWLNHLLPRNHASNYYALSSRIKQNFPETFLTWQCLKNCLYTLNMVYNK